MGGRNKVYWLSLPRSSGSFQAHLQQVEKSLKDRLNRENCVEFSNWPPDGEDGGQRRPLLVLFQSQGRPGDEFPSVLPLGIRGSQWQVVVVVIQDDETTSVQRNIVPEGVALRGLVSVHVIPGQHRLHSCQKNQDAVQTIAELLELGKKAGWRQIFQPVENLVSWLFCLLGAKRAPTVYLLLLPQSTGAFQSHLKSLGDSLRTRLEASHRVQLQLWAPGQQRPDSIVLILFRSQGRPGDELPSALPAQLREGQQTVLVAVVQDDEMTVCSEDIVPAGVPVVTVVSLHVVPGQRTLHACPRNTEALLSIASHLALSPRSWPACALLWLSAAAVLGIAVCRYSHPFRVFLQHSFWNPRKAVMPRETV